MRTLLLRPLLSSPKTVLILGTNLRCTIRITDDDPARQVEEKAGVDDAWDAPDCLMHFFGVFWRVAKDDVEEEVSIFCDEKSAVVILAPGSGVPKALDFGAGGRGAVKKDFDRQ